MRHCLDIICSQIIIGLYDETTLQIYACITTRTATIGLHIATSS